MCHWPPFGDTLLDFSELLGLINSEWIYPLDESIIANLLAMIESIELIQNGQLTLNGFNVDPIAMMDQWGLSQDNLYKIIDWYSEDSNIDNLNESIKDEINKIEWGFSDEYCQCSECINIFRTSPDSYDWTKQYYDTEWGYICSECANNGDYKEECIERIQTAIKRDNQPISLPHIFDTSGLKKVYIDAECQYYNRWQNGMHHGMNDDPLRQGKIVHNIQMNNKPIFDIIFRIYPSQFYIEWDSYIRINPNMKEEYNLSEDNILGLSITEWAENFYNRFDSPDGQFPFDIASLYENALQDHSNNTRFNSISVDPEHGTYNISGTNDFTEYQKGLKS